MPYDKFSQNEHDISSKTIIPLNVNYLDWDSIQKMNRLFLEYISSIDVYEIESETVGGPPTYLPRKVNTHYLRLDDQCYFFPIAQVQKVIF